MAAYRDPGALAPMLAGTLGGLLTTWVTFTPCFLWIFLGAPFIEALRGNKAARRGALSAITAAVVGVILNLAIWFALHTWFRETRAVRDIALVVRCARARSASIRGRWRCRSRPPGRHLPLQGRHDPDPACLLPSRGSCCTSPRRRLMARRLTVPVTVNCNRRTSSCAAVYVLAFCAVATSVACRRGDDWTKVAEALGKSGAAEMPAGSTAWACPVPTCTSPWMAWTIKPALALGSWLAFRSTAGRDGHGRPCADETRSIR